MVGVGDKGGVVVVKLGSSIFAMGGTLLLEYLVGGSDIFVAAKPFGWECTSFLSTS